LLGDGEVAVAASADSALHHERTVAIRGNALLINVLNAKRLPRHNVSTPSTHRAIEEGIQMS
jgi:hypothetical protein